MSILSKIQALITAANATTGESDTTLTDAVQTLVDGYGSGGGAQTLTKLAEYSVTEPVHAISIAATEQMQKCDVLYLRINLNFDSSEWLYLLVNTSALSGTSAYFAQATSINDIALIALTKQVTINATTKPARYFLFSDTRIATNTLSGGALSNILLSLYTSGHNFTSGTVEIWGYV